LLFVPPSHHGQKAFAKIQRNGDTTKKKEGKIRKTFCGYMVTYKRSLTYHIDSGINAPLSIFDHLVKVKFSIRNIRCDFRIVPEQSFGQVTNNTS
jgi:hypothetical protein